MLDIKNKKIFKPVPPLAKKVTFNNKWTFWRQAETRRLLYNELYWSYLLAVKFCYQDQCNSEIELLSFYKLLYKVPKESSVALLRNYCFYSGRARGVQKNFLMSRHHIRKLMRVGLLHGWLKERC